MLRITEDLCRGALLNDLSAVHKENAVCNLACKAHTPKVVSFLRLPCAKGAVALATEGLFLLDFFILQSLRQPSAATSLYTREAFDYSTFERKS